MKRWTFEKLSDELELVYEAYMEAATHTPKSGEIVWFGDPPRPSDRALFDVWVRMRELEASVYRASGWTEDEYMDELLSRV